jgi:drug/metabolite transporter (DMT)-like permease
MIKKRKWAIMFLATSLYSVLGPMIYLTGLQMSNIVDAAILSRLESLEFLLFATCIIPNSPIDLWAAINAFIILAGVGASSYTGVDEGDGYIILGGACFVGSLLLTKRFLSDVPVGILGMFRVSMGTIVYHTQSAIRNDENNEGYLNVVLWKNLWWFALVYVTIFQAVWLFALQNAKSVHISVGTTGIFLLALMWAYVMIPGTALTDPQKVSCGVITLGVLSGIVRGARGGRKGKVAKKGLVRDSEVGTRGVI